MLFGKIPFWIKFALFGVPPAATATLGLQGVGALALGASAGVILAAPMVLFVVWVLGLRPLASLLRSHIRLIIFAALGLAVAAGIQTGGITVSQLTVIAMLVFGSRLRRWI